MQEFLSLKRGQFARFNFLSNNELFKMLELSMNPAEVCGLPVFDLSS
jgi:hypothetical protein